MGYNSIADIIGLSLFIWPLLPPKITKLGEIPRILDPTAVQGHHRSSSLVSVESSHATLVTNSNFGRIWNRFRDIDA